MLTELPKFKMAIRVLDTVIKEDDERVEAWYLLAYSFFKLKKWINAQDCCMEVKKCLIK